MTLILALGNRDAVVQFSDRRLSNNGRLVDDEATKCGVIFSPIARLAFGYTGIGRLGSFRTLPWLTGALSASARPDYIILGILERLRDNATETFATHSDLSRAPKQHKVLTVMFSGFIYGGDGHASPAYAFLSNYVDFDTGHRFPEVQDAFRLYLFSQNPPRPIERSGFVQRVGNWAGITPADVTRLQATMDRAPHANEVTDVGVRFIRDVAQRRASQASIGSQIESIRVPSDRTLGVATGYHSIVVRRSTYMPAQVSLFPDQHWVVENIRVTPVDADTPPISVPKVKKNEPCPCGSKLRFKKCHGKH